MNTKQPNTKKPKFPILIKRGSSVVKIYRDAKPQGTYYRVVYHLGGKRHRDNFPDLQKATKEAEDKASQLSRGNVDVLQLTGRDRLIYGTALEAVKEFGVRLDAAALEYREARKLLAGVPLVDAARFFKSHHASDLKRKTVADAVDEMIAAKKADGVSELYLADLRYRLGAIKEGFRCDISALVPDDLTRFFGELKLSPRSYNNFRRTLRTFFKFAQDQGWLSKQAELLGRIRKRKEKSAPVEIFSPTELAALLECATADVVPCLAIAAFAGLRSEEVLRLEWEDLERSPGFVVIGAHKAKTATRRLVPISHNLAQWLAIVPHGEGRVWQTGKTWFFHSLQKAAKKAGVTWKQNALRHSWITYRLAEIQNVNQVALEAGNSPQMIFRHYRELATPEQARAWFSIKPGGAEKC